MCTLYGFTMFEVCVEQFFIFFTLHLMVVSFLKLNSDQLLGAALCMHFISNHDT